MSKINFLIVTIFTFGCAASNPPTPTDTPPSIHTVSAQRLDGKQVKFSDFKGKVVLISNIATKCGTTPQLKDLQALHENYKEQGLVVIGFPSSDFSPWSSKDHYQEITNTCRKVYGVTFPLFSPDAVIGPKEQEVFKFLTNYPDEEINGEVGFNFEKFLIAKDGTLRARFGPFTSALSAAVKVKLDRLLRE